MIFTEPILAGNSPRPPSGSKKTQKASKPAEGESRAGRILVVEDDYFVGLALETALEGAGFTVLGVVTTGEEALVKAAELRPQLVLMDIRLAGPMDGIETARELRRQNIPSLFASAHSDPATRSRGQSARPLGWITKPFSDAALVDAVTAAVGRLSRD